MSEGGTVRAPAGAGVVNWKEDIWKFACLYYFIPRTLVGMGVDKTLELIEQWVDPQHRGSLEGLVQTPRQWRSGTQVNGWTVPQEWSLRNRSLIISSTGKIIADSNRSPLSVMIGSIPYTGVLTGAELLPQLHYLPDYPEAIPYVTSYYSNEWGFCVDGGSYAFVRDHPMMPFQVELHSELKSGWAEMLEYVLPGRLDQEILFSTYICHPGMGNNETSGPAVLVNLIRWLCTQPRKYTYRFYFGPETLGPICLLSDPGIRQHLKERVIAGWVVTCVGDEWGWSYLETPSGTTLTDRVSQTILKNRKPVTQYKFASRGSDERQWCYPTINLPIGSIMRSKYGTYREYHTDQDDLTFISAQGLFESFTCYQDVIQTLESVDRPRATSIGEPFLRQYGWKLPGKELETAFIQDLLAYADGLESIPRLWANNFYQKTFEEVQDGYAQLKELGLVEY